MKNTMLTKKFITTLFFITLGTSAVYGSISEEKPTQLELQGIFETDRDRSLCFPLEAYIDGTQLILTFFDTIEDVTISIIGISGTIKTHTASFNYFETITFDINRYAAGNYSLLITTPRGTYLSGSFKTGY